MKTMKTMKTMKSSLPVVAIVLIMLCNLSALGQIENIKMTSDSSLVIEKLYLGGVGKSIFSTERMHVGSYGHIRLGAAARWDITKWMSLNTYYMYQIETENSWGLNQFSLKIAPCKKWNIQFGQMATISTQQRPHPVSAGGQFETWTEDQIPGGALGVKTSYAPNEHFSFGTGVAVRSKEPEYHANICFKRLTLSAYYGVADEKAGMAFTYSGTNAWTTVVWKQDKVIADRFGCKLSKKQNICLYSDFGYDVEQQKIARGEAGIYKIFTGKYWSVLPALGYNYQERAIRGYLFVHI